MALQHLAQHMSRAVLCILMAPKLLMCLQRAAALVQKRQQVSNSQQSTQHWSHTRQSSSPAGPSDIHSASRNMLRPEPAAETARSGVNFAGVTQKSFVAGNKDAASWVFSMQCLLQWCTDKPRSPEWFSSLIDVGLHCRRLHHCSKQICDYAFPVDMALRAWIVAKGWWQMQVWKAQLHLGSQKVALLGQLHSRVGLSSLKGKSPAAWTWYLQLLRSRLRPPPSQHKCP